MADETGGQPLPNGEGPDSQGREADDEVFGAVVLDEGFVEAARIHEPTAAERVLYAALERAETEAVEERGAPPVERDPEAGASRGPASFDSWGHEDDGRFDRSDYTRYLPWTGMDAGPARSARGKQPPAARPPGERQASGRRGTGRPVGRPMPRPAAPPARRLTRWQRPIACVLAMVMGISLVAVAVLAVQRASSPQRSGFERVPPPSTEPGGAAASGQDGG